MQGLTERQQELVDYVNDYISQYNQKPTHKEIAHHLNIATVTMRAKLQMIENKGLLMTNYGWLEIPEDRLKTKRERDKYGNSR